MIYIILLHKGKLVQPKRLKELRHKRSISNRTVHLFRSSFAYLDGKLGLSTIININHMVLQSKLFKVAEVQITYNPKFKVSERPQISSSKDAYQILTQQWDSGKIEFLEEFKIPLLNRRNRVLGIVNISQGGIAGTVADPKVIFLAALKSCASGIILAHNHPSGEIDPSKEDINLTNKIKAGAKLLDIELLDHLIISIDGFYSFADEGLMQNITTTN